MYHKYETFEKLIQFKSKTKKQFGKNIKALRLDRDDEYLSGEFLDFLIDNGILIQLTSPRTLQLNGVVERRNITLLDMVRSMLSYCSLPVLF